MTSGSTATVGQITNGGRGLEQRSAGKKCKEGRFIYGGNMLMLGFGFDRSIGLVSVRWLSARPIERSLSSSLGWEVVSIYTFEQCKFRHDPGVLVVDEY